MDVCNTILMITLSVMLDNSRPTSGIQMKNYSAQLKDATNKGNISQSSSRNFVLDEASDEKRLAQTLLRNYKLLGKIGRPVKNSSHPLHLKFGMGLISMNVEEKENMLSLSVWTKLVRSWSDEYLTWEPDYYGNMTIIKLPQDQIWTPDLMLYNTASTESFERSALAVIHSGGTVHWFPHRIYHTTCSIDVTKFPFDKQTCNMLFGSWTHTSDEIDVDFIFPGGLDLSTFQRDFKESSKWEILDVEAERSLAGNVEEEGSGFAVLIITVHLKRKMIFSSYILTFPVILLGFLTSLLFWLPTGSTDKTNLGLTIFGGLLLLLLILVEAAPPTASGVPMLGVYYCFNIAVVIFSIFLSSIVSKVESCQDVVKLKRVPILARKIFFDGIGRFVCTYNSDFDRHVKMNMSRQLDYVSHHQHQQQHHNHHHHHHHENEPLDITTTFETVESKCDSKRCNGDIGVGVGLGGGVDSVSRTIENIDKPIAELCAVIRKYMCKKQEEERRAQIRSAIEAEWRYLGVILDRTFMVIYLTVVVLSVVILFPR